MPATITHPRIEASVAMSELLFAEGARLAFEAADAVKRLTARRRKTGVTLRPGKTAPLWNALRTELEGELRTATRRASPGR